MNAKFQTFGKFLVSLGFTQDMENYREYTLTVRHYPQRPLVIKVTKAGNVSLEGFNTGLKPKDITDLGERDRAFIEQLVKTLHN